MSKWIRNYRMVIEDTNHQFVTITYPLTCEFAIERSLMASANIAKFYIYNLSLENRNRLYKNESIAVTPEYFRTIEFYAGYGEDLTLIFSGNVRSAKSYRQGGTTDNITEIDAFDNSFAMTNQKSKFEMDGRVARQDVVQRLINDLKETGIKQGETTTIDGYHPMGVSVVGNTWRILQTYTGGFAFIDCGYIRVLKPNEVYGETIVEIDSSSGLLGSPAQDGLKLAIPIVFEPSILVGQLINLKSSSYPMFNGHYKVLGINHAGTISGATCGEVKTTLQLSIGNKIWNIVTRKSA